MHDLRPLIFLASLLVLTACPSSPKETHPAQTTAQSAPNTGAEASTTIRKVEVEVADPTPPNTTPHAHKDSAHTSESEAGSGALGGDAVPEEAMPSKDPKAVRHDWIDWVATNCRVNELGPSKYAHEWMTWIRKERRSFDSFMPPDAPRLNLHPKPIPKPGTPEANARAKALREDWLSNPRSQIVECSFSIEPRSCDICYPTNRRYRATRSAYTAYLPKALFTEPERVRSMLILAPGGNGGRTRYFLTPIPNKGVWDKRSGGLEIKRHSDEIYAADPTLSPSIVVSLDHAGWPMANGPAEFLSHDAPLHFAQTYLGLDTIEDIAIGVEGISKGARAIMLSLRQKPAGFHVVGLTCLHCGNEGAKGGFQPHIEMHMDVPTLESWAETLRSRRAQNLFHMRFSVGNLDVQWPCVKRVHNYFTKHNILPDEPPTFSKCRKPRRWRSAHPPAPNANHCNTTWGDFHLFDRAAHNYGLLIPSWRPQLTWLLTQLSTSVHALQVSKKEQK